VGRIECGGGEGGEPAPSPLGWKSYASRVHRSNWCAILGYAGRHWPNRWHWHTPRTTTQCKHVLY
jgi:hypothetical protein